MLNTICSFRKKTRGRLPESLEPRRIIRLGWHNAPNSRYAGLRALSFGIMFMAGLSPALHAEGSNVGGVLAAHPLKAIHGESEQLRPQDSQVTVLAFWATWCKPCKEEMPKLEALHESMIDRGGRVVAVSVDRNPQNVRRFLNQHNLELPVFVDGPDGLAKQLDLGSLPMTYVLDRQGWVLVSLSSSDQWNDMVRTIELELASDQTHLEKGPY